MQQSKSKQKQNAFQYKCPQNKKAEFCCAEPKCNNIALKCITSNKCDLCKRNHSKCPKQIRIDKIVQVAKQKAKKCPVNLVPLDFQDLLKKLIDQLTKIRQEFIDYKNKKMKTWGLSKQLSDLLFNQQVQNKTSKLIANLIEKDPQFADPTFYLPKQFQKDVNSVKAVNNTLQKRIFTYFQCYRVLAQCDLQSKIIQKIDIRVGQKQKNSFVELSLTKLKQLHQKLKTVILDRLNLSRFFADAEQSPTKKQIQDYHIISKRLLKLSMTAIRLLYDNKDYKEVLIFIGLVRDLFSLQRLQFRLLQAQYKKQLQQIEQIQAYCFYHTKRYQQAYNYFIKLLQTQLNIKSLKILIQLCQILKINIDIYLKYLLLYIQLQADNTQILQKILQCYTHLNRRQMIYEYIVKLNLLYKAKLRQFSLEKKIRYFQRQLWRIQYLRSINKYYQESLVMGQFLDLIRFYYNDSFSLFEMYLKIRYRLVNILKFQAKQVYGNTAGNGAYACQEYLSARQKQSNRSQQLPESAIKTIKQYMLKFLILQAQPLDPSQQKYAILQKCTKICEQIKVKFFQPYYSLATLSYQLNKQKQTVLEYQDKSNQIYPTYQCYCNKAYILYYLALKQDPISKNMLQECVEAIDKSLKLNPLQKSIYFLRGLANQNLQKYRESNRDFQIALAHQQKSKEDNYLIIFNIQKKMALNYELIAKHEKKILSQNQLLKILEKAQKLYQKCLQTNFNDATCHLGYARTLKLNNKLNESQMQLKNVIQIQQKRWSQPNRKQKSESYERQQAYMILGNIYEEKGKLNEDRDFDMLQIALELYLQAGKIRENKDNVIRIYKQLDNQRKARQVQDDSNWI